MSPARRSRYSRRSRRRSYGRRRYSTRRGRTNKLVRKVMRMIAPEVKSRVWDSAVDGLGSGPLVNMASIGNSWVGSFLMKDWAPAKGADKNQRIGDKITVRSIEIRAIISNGASGAILDDDYDTVRIVIGKTEYPYCPQFAGNGPWTINTTSKDKTSRNAGIKKIYCDRMLILKSGPRYPVTSGTAAMVVPHHFNFRKYFKKGLTFTYDSTTLQWDKDIFFNAISDSAVPPNPGFLNWNVRVTYTDA